MRKYEEKEVQVERSNKERRDASAYELLDAAGLIGCVKGATKDLSTKKRYFAGFGESKSRGTRPK